MNNNTINAGYFLDKYFKIADQIKEKQKQLFIKNNLFYLDIKNLPDTDKIEFNKLSNINDRVMKGVCKTIADATTNYFKNITL